MYLLKEMRSKERGRDKTRGRREGREEPWQSSQIWGYGLLQLVSLPIQRTLRRQRFLSSCSPRMWSPLCFLEVVVSDNDDRNDRNNDNHNKNSSDTNRKQNKIKKMIEKKKQKEKMEIEHFAFESVGSLSLPFF